VTETHLAFFLLFNDFSKTDNARA